MRLAEVIVLTANYYNKTLSHQLLSMYLEDLKGHDEAKLIDAYGKYRRDPRNKTFPLPAQILEILNPTVSDEAMAAEVAGRILYAVKEIGYTKSVRAREYIGEIGWQVVKDFGGWTYICENLGTNIQPSAFMAQARGAAKAKLEIAKSGGFDPSLTIGHAPSPQLEHDPSQKTSQILETVGMKVKSTTDSDT